MKTQHYTSVLWMLFGFSFLMALVNSLEALVHLYMHYGLTKEFTVRRFTYYLPLFSAIVYGLTALFLLLLMHDKLKKNTPLKLPKLVFLGSVIIAILLEIMIPRVSDQHLKTLFDDRSKTEYMSSVDFGKVFDIVDHCVFISQWFFIISAILYLYFKLHKNSKNI